MFEPTLVGKWLPSPRVKVTFDDLDPATDTVTVWRKADVLAAVPGTVRAFAVGGYTVDDLWAPHSIELTYYADMFNASGVKIGTTGSSTVTVWGDRAAAVFCDPFDPENSVVVDMDESFGEQLGRKREIQTYDVGGQVVSLLGNIGLLEDIDLSVKSDTQEQSDALASVLGQSLVLIRLAPFVRPMFPTLLYAVVQAQVVDAGHLGGFQFGGQSATWRVTGTEVTPITSGAAVSSSPWQSYVDAFETWDDMKAAYPTWLDAKKNPPGA